MILYYFVEVLKLEQCKKFAGGISVGTYLEAVWKLYQPDCQNLSNLRSWLHVWGLSQRIHRKKGGSLISSIHGYNSRPKDMKTTDVNAAEFLELLAKGRAACAKHGARLWGLNTFRDPKIMIPEHAKAGRNNDTRAADASSAFQAIWCNLLFDCSEILRERKQRVGSICM